MNSDFTEVCINGILELEKCNYYGCILWDYSGYYLSGLGITEYTEFQFRKER